MLKFVNFVGTSPLPQAPMMTIPFQVGIGSGPPIPPSSFQPPHFESLASSTWSGLLPQKQYSNPVYSCKIFLGGVPWDVTEVGLIQVKKNELFSTFKKGNIFPVASLINLNF